MGHFPSTALPWVWGATAQEIAAEYPCDRLDPSGARLLRAVSSAAPAARVYRWLCQLRVAPYSYDRVDNLGVVSPRQLTPGVERLAVGQPVMTIFDLTCFTLDHDMTLTTRPGAAERLFGRVVVSYAVRPDRDGSRLVAALRLGAGTGPVAAARSRALAWGDLLMMRRQLLTLAELAATPDS